jgi:hypothetical protein
MELTARSSDNPRSWPDGLGFFVLLTMAFTPAIPVSARLAIGIVSGLIPAVATVDSNVSGSGSAGYDSQASLEGGGRR